MVLKTDTGRSVRLGQPLRDGRGGDAEVWSIRNDPHLVFKRYHRADKREERAKKLAYMLRHPPKFLQGESRQAVVWPTAVVREKGKFVGFTMPKVTDCVSLLHFTGPELRSSPEAPLKHWRHFERSHFVGQTNRLLLCYNLCVALQALHRSGHYVHGDLKSKNILVDRTGFVRIIDMDTVQITNTSQVLFPALACTQGYRPPSFYTDAGRSLAGHRLTPSWDYFSFVVLCYEILVGIHPSMASHPKATNFDQAIAQRLFVHGSNHASFTKIPDLHWGFTLIPSNIQRQFLSDFQRDELDLTVWRRILKAEINQRLLSTNPPTAQKSGFFSSVFGRKRVKKRHHE